jgi:hypothetical protein
MKINEVLKRQPIVRMGAPVRSWQSRGAEIIQTPGAEIGYATGGNVLAGLSNALKSGLGFYGAMQDARNQQAYNENLAQLAEQERQEELAKQAYEQDFNERKLEQQMKIEQLKLQEQERIRQQQREQALADRAAQYAHEQDIYNRNRADILADKEAQYAHEQAMKQAEREYQETQDIEKAKRDKLKSELDAQQFLSILENPNQAITAQNVGWLGRIFGRPKYKLSVADIIRGNIPSYSTEEEAILNKGLK